VVRHPRVSQASQGRYFIIENPQGSAIWKLPVFKTLWEKIDADWGVFDMCAYGMRDPVNNLLYYKPTGFMHNLPPGILEPMFRRCLNK
jgi:hypothetical protein